MTVFKEPKSGWWVEGDWCTAWARCDGADIQMTFRGADARNIAKALEALLPGLLPEAAARIDALDVVKALDGVLSGAAAEDQLARGQSI